MSESEQQYSSESKYSFEGRSRANAIVDSPSSHGSRTADAAELDFDTLSISGASSRDSRQVDFKGCSTDGISADAKDYPRESHARHTRRNSCPDLGTFAEHNEKRKSASFRKKSFAGLKVDMNVALKGTDELAVGLHSVTGRITEPRELPISKDGVRSRRHSTTGVSPLRVVVESKESKEEGKASEQDAEIMSEYEMTANGEFNIQGFSISKYGIMRTPRGKHNHYAHHDELEGATMSDALVKVRVLGKGSSGTVTKMLHIPTLKLVAVKAIACFEQSKRAEVLHELQTLNQNAVPIDEEEEVEEEKDGRIHCDNIVSFYNAFINRSRDSVSFVEEYMDGGTLQSVVDAGGCTCEETLSTIAQGLLKGLAFLHGRGQIHRDVKPSNILVNRHGDVKISDFGISVRPARGQLCTSFVGTLMFMSPERILSKEYSFNADIWGLGVTMAAIALGKLPFECDPGYWGLVRRVGEGPRIRLPRDGALSDMFCDFVELCLEKDPLERPSAKELLEHEFVSFSHMNHTKVANLFPMAKRPSTAEQQAAINPVVSAFVKYHQLTLSANQKYKESGERAPTKIPQVPQEQLDQLAEQLQCDVDLVSSTMSNAINRANSMNMVAASARSPLHKHNPRRRRHQDSPVGVHTASAV